MREHFNRRRPANTNKGYKRGRPRYLTFEDIHNGIGIFQINPRDFPRDLRETLADQLEAACEKRRIKPKLLPIAVRLVPALRSPEPMMAALRDHLEVDGHELRCQVAHIARAVPALKPLAAWV